MSTSTPARGALEVPAWMCVLHPTSTGPHLQPPPHPRHHLLVTSLVDGPPEGRTAEQHGSIAHQYPDLIRISVQIFYEENKRLACFYILYYLLYIYINICIYVCVGVCVYI